MNTQDIIDRIRYLVALELETTEPDLSTKNGEYFYNTHSILAAFEEAAKYCKDRDINFNED